MHSQTEENELPPAKAKAPKIKPGGREAAKERQNTARTVFRVTATGSDLDFTIAPNNLPVRLRREMRAQIGKSPRQFLGDEGAPDIDTVVMLWWAHRRTTGEQITYLDVENEWDDAFGHLVYDDISVVQVLEVEDDPEA